MIGFLPFFLGLESLVLYLARAAPLQRAFFGAPGMARSALTGAVPVQVVLAG